MDFDREIRLSVVDRTQARLARINERLDRLRKVIDRQKQSTDRVTRSQARLAGVLNTTQRAFVRLGSVALRVLARIQAASRRALGGLARALGGVTGRIAGLGALGIGGAVAGTTADARGLRANARAAAAAGLDVNQFSQLSRFLQAASDGQLDRDGVRDLIAEFRNRFGEARADRQGATFTGLETAERLLGQTGLAESIITQRNVAEQLSRVTDVIRNLSQRGFRNEAQFLSEEFFGGTEGRVINEIANLPAELLRNFRRAIDDTEVRASPQDVAAANDLSVSFLRLRGSLIELGQRVVRPLVPALSEGVDKIADSLQRFASGDGPARLSQRLQSITQSVTDLISGLVSSGTVEATANGLLATLDSILSRVQSVVNGIGQAFASIERFLSVLGFDTGPRAQFAAPSAPAAPGRAFPSTPPPSVLAARRAAISSRITPDIAAQNRQFEQQFFEQRLRRAGEEAGGLADGTQGASRAVGGLASAVDQAARQIVNTSILLRSAAASSIPQTQAAPAPLDPGTEGPF